MAAMYSLLKPMKGLVVAKPLPRNVGLPPNENKTVIRCAETTSQKVIEGIKIAIPRHRQPKNSRELGSSLCQRAAPAALNNVHLLGGRSGHARPSSLTIESTAYLQYIMSFWTIHGFLHQ
jgi:hypothetical protein